VKGFVVCEWVAGRLGLCVGIREMRLQVADGVLDADLREMARAGRSLGLLWGEFSQRGAFSCSAWIIFGA